MTPGSGGPILTLEPFIDAVREGVESAGWSLSGLQKTTSHQFEGRWAGDETRSAYLFFHDPASDLPVSIDVYLDETSRGLTGNLALVVDLHRLADVGPVELLLGRLADLAGAALIDGYRTPLTLRFRLRDADQDPGTADTEVRFKLRVPNAALDAGPAAVAALSSASVKAFQSLLSLPDLQSLVDPD